MAKICKWDYDGEMHETQCNKAIVWNDGEIPLDIKYCPYCGGKIEKLKTIEQ